MFVLLYDFLPCFSTCMSVHMLTATSHCQDACLSELKISSGDTLVVTEGQLPPKVLECFLVGKSQHIVLYLPAQSLLSLSIRGFLNYPYGWIPITRKQISVTLRMDMLRRLKQTLTHLLFVAATWWS